MKKTRVAGEIFSHPVGRVRKQEGGKPGITGYIRVVRVKDGKEFSVKEGSLKEAK